MSSMEISAAASTPPQMGSGADSNPAPARTGGGAGETRAAESGSQAGAPRSVSRAQAQQGGMVGQIIDTVV